MNNTFSQLSAYDDKWRHWSSYMEMLSADGSYAFLDDLGFRRIQSDFRSIRLMARACTEVSLQPSVTRGSLNDPERRHFDFAWQHYTALPDTVLSEEERVFLAAGSESKWTNGAELFVQLYPRWLSDEIALGLIRWFYCYFPKYDRPLWPWPRALRKTLPIEGSEFSEIEQLGLTPEIVEPVSMFLRDVESFEHSIQERFRLIETCAAQSMPTPWNRVLQTCPADSCGVYASTWIGDVRESIEQRQFIFGWRRLKNQIGEGQFSRFIEIVKVRFAEVPNSDELFDVPEPFEW